MKSKFFIGQRFKTLSVIALCSVFLATASCGLLPNEKGFMAVAGKVVYDANFPSDDGWGSVPTDSATYGEGDQVTVKENTGELQVSGYRFDGWATTTYASLYDGEIYRPGEKFEMPLEKVTLYAVWQYGEGYSVIYDEGAYATGGTPPTDSREYSSYNDVTIKANTGGLYRNGYNFGGWTTSYYSGNGTTYAVGSTITISSDLYLYPRWVQPIGSAINLPISTSWTVGNLTGSGTAIYYSVSVSPGQTYGISWDDDYSGSGTYTGDIQVTAYHVDAATEYFTERDSSYFSPSYVTVPSGETTLYLLVESFNNSDSFGDFAIQVTQ